MNTQIFNQFKSAIANGGLSNAVKVERNNGAFCTAVISGKHFRVDLSAETISVKLGENPIKVRSVAEMIAVFAVTGGNVNKEEIIISSEEEAAVVASLMYIMDCHVGMGKYQAYVLSIQETARIKALEAEAASIEEYNAKVEEALFVFVHGFFKDGQFNIESSFEGMINSEELDEMFEFDSCIYLDWKEDSNGIVEFTPSHPHAVKIAVDTGFYSSDSTKIMVKKGLSFVQLGSVEFFHEYDKEPCAIFRLENESITGSAKVVADYRIGKIDKFVNANLVADIVNKMDVKSMMKSAVNSRIEKYGNTFMEDYFYYRLNMQYQFPGTEEEEYESSKRQFMTEVFLRWDDPFTFETVDGFLKRAEDNNWDTIGNPVFENIVMTYREEGYKFSTLSEKIKDSWWHFLSSKNSGIERDVYVSWFSKRFVDNGLEYGQNMASFSRGFEFMEHMNSEQHSLWGQGKKRIAISSLPFYIQVATMTKGSEKLINVSRIGMLHSPVGVSLTGRLSVKDYSNTSATLLMYANYLGDKGLSFNPKEYVGFGDNMIDLMNGASKQLIHEINSLDDLRMIGEIVSDMQELTDEVKSAKTVQGVINAVLSDERAKAFFKEYKEIRAAKVYNRLANKKQETLIPIVKFAGENMSVRHLEKENPINLIIGEITSCCQKIDGAGEEVCIDGWKDPYSINYIFENKSGNFYAHTWVWQAKNGDIILDSVESRDFVSVKEIAECIIGMAKEYAKIGLKVAISEDVSYGCTGEVLEELKKMEVLSPVFLCGESKTEYRYQDTDPDDDIRYIICDNKVAEDLNLKKGIIR